MEPPQPLRRQPHGSKVQQTTITIPAGDMTRLRKEAHADKITVSRHVVNAIRRDWALADALPAAAAARLAELAGQGDPTPIIVAALVAFLNRQYDPRAA